jgi:hypothetical protein
MQWQTYINLATNIISLARTTLQDRKNQHKHKMKNSVYNIVCSHN